MSQKKVSKKEAVMVEWKKIANLPTPDPIN